MLSYVSTIAEEETDGTLIHLINYFHLLIDWFHLVITLGQSRVGRNGALNIRHYSPSRIGSWNFSRQTCWVVPHFPLDSINFDE